MTDRLPTPPGFFDAVLRVRAEHPNGVARAAVYEAVADRMGLTPEQRAVRIPSGTIVAYRHRCGWALTMLKQAGLARSVARGIWGITDAGTSLVRTRPGGLTEDDLRNIDRTSRAAVVQADAEERETVELSPGLATQQTPDEQIDTAVETIRSGLARELLDLIGRCSPDFFETLVLDLLHAMGYGSKRDDLRRVGRSGDGGIDGVINLDKLGLEKVYVQAKRWRGTVGRPEIQAFYGALADRRARKGVFITTSGYSREAQEYAERVSGSIVLVDGARLAELMIDHGIGVHHERTVHIPKLDSDYFEGL